MSTKVKISLVSLMILVAGISVFSLTAVEAAGEEALPENATLSKTSIESVGDWAADVWKQAIALAPGI